MKEDQMNHEKLICYRRLIEVADRIGRLVNGWPRGHSYLADQIQRAIASSVLNLAEGNGKQGVPKERRRFFMISLGSISETLACLDLCQAFSLITELESTELKLKLKESYCGIRKLP
jgi:four helix bundle protein